MLIKYWNFQEMGNLTKFLYFILKYLDAKYVYVKIRRDKYGKKKS